MPSGGSSNLLTLDGPWAPPPWVWWLRSQGHSTGPETALCSTWVLETPWGLALGMGSRSPALSFPDCLHTLTHCLLPFSRVALTLCYCVSLRLGACLSLFLGLSLSLYFPPASISVLFSASVPLDSLSFRASTVFDPVSLHLP